MVHAKLLPVFLILASICCISAEYCTRFSGCDDDYVCCNKHCVYGSSCYGYSCVLDSECSSNEVCCGGECYSGNSCSGKFCSSNLDCSSGQYCCSGFCSWNDCTNDDLVVTLGLVFGVIFTIVAIVAIIVWCRRRYRPSVGRVVRNQPQQRIIATTTTTTRNYQQPPGYPPLQGTQPYGFQPGYPRYGYGATSQTTNQQPPMANQQPPMTNFAAPPPYEAVASGGGHDDKTTCAVPSAPAVM